MPLKQKMEIRGSADEETSFDVYPDYEFDAAQFFDFTRPETRSEEEEAELWFNSAPVYPPSRERPVLGFYRIPLFSNHYLAKLMHESSGIRDVSKGSISKVSRVWTCYESAFTEMAHWGVPVSLNNFKKAKDLHHQQDGRPTISDIAAEDDAPVSRINPYNDGMAYKPKIRFSRP